MIRKAVFDDIELIEDAYNEHFEYEAVNGAFTIFKKGVYPTRKDAEKAVQSGSLYVYEENNGIAGSIIANKQQPSEYEKVAWSSDFAADEVTVIHLLMVRPSMAGRGIASALVKFVEETARKNACKALRLDTGGQNIPALRLYNKLGFKIAAKASMKVGGILEHSGHMFLEKVL